MAREMPKILLVEDDSTMATLLKTLLEMEGYQVSVVKDKGLDEILDVLETLKPDLALIDVNMRQVNGFDLLRHIRKMEELHALRVVMSSGMDFSDQCRDAGADKFILKPYMPDDLIAMIRQLIQAK
jgi:CheY-like chemotaxis protein